MEEQEMEVIDFDEEGMFINEDRNKFREDFLQSSSFAHELFRDLLTKYGMENLLDVSKHGASFEAELSPYCEHIGEAVIMVSYANRLKFKLLFDEKYHYMMESDFYYEKFATDFCKGFYVDGHVEQFLIVCGFFVDLAVYLFCKSKINLSGSLPNLFGDMFRYLMREIFFDKGGWKEIKRKAKPWWHSYRNIKYKQMLDTERREARISSEPIINFHNPQSELCNNNFSRILKAANYSTEIQTQADYPDVALEDVVPKNTSRLSPICEIEGPDEKPKKKKKQERRKRNTKRL